MSENYNINSIQKTNSQAKRKNHHKYIFSKYNILNHENGTEVNDIKGSNHFNEYNQKSHLTNSLNNSILVKFKNKLKEKEKQEISYMIEYSKKFKKNINLNNKIFSKSLERKKQKIKKSKDNNNESSFIAHKYSEIISPLHNNNLKFVQNNLHKRINSTHFDKKEKGVKKSKYNNSFRGFKKKIKLNNRSFELIIDNNNNENNANNDNENYEKKISLTNVVFDNSDNKNNISNDIYIISSPKDDSIDDELINNEELINMSKKKQEILEEIKLKKQELKLTELSIELLKHKYKKKSNEQLNPASSSHINNKIINNYNLTVSIPDNNIKKNNSSLNKKSFFAKTSLYKNRKKISPTYNKELNSKVNNSFQMRNNYINHININLKSKNNTIRNKSKQSGISPYEKKVFSFPKKKEKNSEKKNSEINAIHNKNNLTIKFSSPEKDNNNHSIENSNNISNKTQNNNINKKNLKLVIIF